MNLTRNTRLSGLEPLQITPESNFINIGERTNVTGTRAVQETDPREPLRRGGRGRAAAGRKRRAGARRQHGRGHAGFGKGDGGVPPADRRRTRHRAHPGDGRLVEVERHRVGAEMPAGQGHRQFDLDEGRRGGVPAPGAAGAALWCRRGGDGVRRGRPGRQHRTQGRDLFACLSAADRADRLSARGHHLRSQRVRDRHGHRRAQQLRGRLHRSRARAQAALSAEPCLRRRFQRQLLVPRQRAGAPGDPRRLPVPRDPRRHGHGHRQRRRPAAV